MLHLWNINAVLQHHFKSCVAMWYAWIEFTLFIIHVLVSVSWQEWKVLGQIAKRDGNFHIQFMNRFTSLYVCCVVCICCGWSFQFMCSHIHIRSPFIYLSPAFHFAHCFPDVYFHILYFECIDARLNRTRPGEFYLPLVAVRFGCFRCDSTMFTNCDVLLHADRFCAFDC